MCSPSCTIRATRERTSTGGTRQRKVRPAGQARYRRLPRDEWKVFLPNAHPGYITWEQFEANQEALRASAQSIGADRRRSAPREGVALLQGLVICGRCGGRMTVRYIVSHGHPEPVYRCQRRGIQRAEPACQHLPGAAIDRAVSELVLETVTPASIDVRGRGVRRAAVPGRRDRSRQAGADCPASRGRRAAQRQFLLVRPENRLVADNLERHWNEALQRLAAAEEAYAGAGKTQPPVTPEMKERVAALVADLPRVWHDPRTPARDRKRMLRLLVEDVTLLRDDVIRVSIRWRGGATREVECPLPLAAPDLRRTPAAVVEQVRALATEQTDAQDRRDAQRAVAPHRDRVAIQPPARPHAARGVRHRQLRRAPDQGGLADRTADGRATRRASGHGQALRAPRRAARCACRRQGNDTLQAAHGTAARRPSRETVTRPGTSPKACIACTGKVRSMEPETFPSPSPARRTRPGTDTRPGTPRTPRSEPGPGRPTRP